MTTTPSFESYIRTQLHVSSQISIEEGESGEGERSIVINIIICIGVSVRGVLVHISLSKKKLRTYVPGLQQHQTHKRDLMVRAREAERVKSEPLWMVRLWTAWFVDLECSFDCCYDCVLARFFRYLEGQSKSASFYVTGIVS